jgi:hypothetical protein
MFITCVFNLWIAKCKPIQLYFPKKFNNMKRFNLDKVWWKFNLGVLGVPPFDSHTLTLHVRMSIHFKIGFIPHIGPLSQFDLEKNLVFSFIPKRTICCPLEEVGHTPKLELWYSPPLSNNPNIVCVHY